MTIVLVKERIKAAVLWYLRPMAIFRVGEVVHIGDLYSVGHPHFNDCYARVVEKKYVADFEDHWSYRLHFGNCGLNLWIPERYLRKV